MRDSNLMIMTRFHSNLRPTTCESVIAKNPMTHANLMALSFVEPELWATEVLHRASRDFLLFCSCDNLDLDQITLISFSVQICIILYPTCHALQDCQVQHACRS